MKSEIKLVCNTPNEAWICHHYYFQEVHEIKVQQNKNGLIAAAQNKANSGCSSSTGYQM